ncbi:MAG: hypothetical protein GY842_01860, partial [bacterium]|nr:hypothetical protein [bacterium]
SDVDLYDYWWFQQCRGALACATCPADATVIEDEADCGLPTDTTNGGCNTGGTDFEALVNGSKFCGTFASSNGTSNGEPNSIRDTDWYEFTLLSDSTVTLNFVGEAPADVSLVNGDCDELYGVSAGTPAACEPIDGFSTDLPAGTYYLVIAPQFDDDLEVPCPTRYNGGLSWTATTLPTGACCPPDEFCVQRKEFTCSVERGEYHGDGSSCTPDPCEELPPIGPLCPANSIFGPGHSTNHGTAATSDQSP